MIASIWSALKVVMERAGRREGWERKKRGDDGGEGEDMSNKGEKAGGDSDKADLEEDNFEDLEEGGLEEEGFLEEINLEKEDGLEIMLEGEI